jgi:hypothetical protein
MQNSFTKSTKMPWLIAPVSVALAASPVPVVFAKAGSESLAYQSAASEQFAVSNMSAASGRSSLSEPFAMSDRSAVSEPLAIVRSVCCV